MHDCNCTDKKTASEGIHRKHVTGIEKLQYTESYIQETGIGVPAQHLPKWLHVAQ
jgi:hypothetical protein